MACHAEQLRRRSNSGIVGASIVRAASSTNANADFLSYDPILGFISGVPLSPLTNTFSGSTSASVANITTATSVGSGTVDVAAVKTTANISNGTLRIRSLSTIDQGAILMNGVGGAAPVISSNVIFNPAATTGGTAASGEGLVYVSGGYTSGTATISGSVLANGFTKFGAGTLQLTGTGNGILGALTVQNGTLQLNSTPSTLPQTTALVLNDLGTLDVNGSRDTVASLAGNGIIGNSSTSTAGGIVVSGTTNTTFSGNIVNAVNSRERERENANHLAHQERYQHPDAQHHRGEQSECW